MSRTTKILLWDRFEYWTRMTGIKKSEAFTERKEKLNDFLDRVDKRNRQNKRRQKRENQWSIDRSKPGPSLEQCDALSDDFSEESDQPLSFSRKKMKLHISTDEFPGNSDEKTEAGDDVSGYRLMDLNNFIISVLHGTQMRWRWVRASLLI